jgi:hypothetical protein
MYLDWKWSYSCSLTIPVICLLCMLRWRVVSVHDYNSHMTVLGAFQNIWRRMQLSPTKSIWMLHCVSHSTLRVGPRWGGSALEFIWFFWGKLTASMAALWTEHKHGIGSNSDIYKWTEKCHTAENMTLPPSCSTCPSMHSLEQMPHPKSRLWNHLNVCLHKGGCWAPFLAPQQAFMSRYSTRQ